MIHVYGATQLFASSADLLITDSSEGPGEAQPSPQSLSCPTVLFLSNKDLGPTSTQVP